MREGRLTMGLMIALAGGTISGTGADEAVVAPVLEAAPVVVTAPPLVEQERITDFGGSVSVVSRAQMDDAGAQDLPSALRRVSGVNISRYTLLGAFGGAEGGSVYIRGRGTGRPGSDIMVYNDGVPRKVGVWDHPLMDVLAVDHADRISIYKGPQPAFNSGSFGSVEIESRRRQEPGMETEAEFWAGEHATLGGRLHHGGNSDGVDYYGGAAYKESDGHRPHSAASLQSLYGRVGHDLGESLNVSAQVLVSDNQVEDPGVAGRPVPVRDEYRTRTVTASVRLDNHSEGLHGFSLAYHEDGQIRWDKDRLVGPESPAGESNTDWENYGFRLGQTLVLDPFQLHGSLDGASEGGETENRTLGGMVPFAYEDRYETLVPGLALDARVKAGPGWELQPSAGVRGYYHSAFDQAIAPHAGLVLKKAGLTLFSNAARGVHYPGVYATGIAANTLEQLEAEILDHGEVGAQWQGMEDRLMLGMTVFRDRTDNLLQWTPRGLLNVGRADADGVEFTTRVHPLHTLALYASLTLLDPDAEKTPRMPAWSASTGASLTLTRRLRLHADVDAVGSQYAINGRDGLAARADVEDIDRYMVGNLQLAYSPDVLETARITLFEGCENIADVHYETLGGYPLPGRFFSGGARVMF